MNSPQWLVRSPQYEDLPILTTIATAVSQPTQPIETAIIQQTNGRFWTITRQNQPIGYATLLPLPGLPHLFELSGGIAPQFQRQGAGSFLWRTVRQAALGTAVQHITVTTDDLDSPTARFLRHHQFELEHEEWTMWLEGLPERLIHQPAKLARLAQVTRETAVRNLPQLYKRCFAHTPWFQPYSATEVAATWEPTDELWTLVADQQPIGFAWLHLPSPHTVEIEPIGIVRENQGMGYGRFLLTGLLQNLQDRLVQTVSLGVWANNKTAVRLYQSVGFQHISSSYSLTYSLNSS